MSGIICVIPARGGSKRIARKNIRKFRGKEMIGWSIQAAFNANCFDRIIVSTDDQEIASVAKAYGAEIPFMRPTELANDFVGTREVIEHAINFFAKLTIHPSAICCLYATAPFVKPNDIAEGFKKFKSFHSNAVVFSATSYNYPVQRALRIDDQGKSSMIDPSHYQTRSQDLEATYHDAGQFYWASPEAWCKNQNFFEGGLPIVLPLWRVQDIDTESDWTRAEIIHKLIEEMSSY